MSSTDPLITDIWRTGSGQSKRFGEPLAVADGDGIRRHPARTANTKAPAAAASARVPAWPPPIDSYRGEPTPALPSSPPGLPRLARRAAVIRNRGEHDLEGRRPRRLAPCGCRLFIRAGQAACRYSWRVPPSRSRRRTSRYAIRSGSVIGSGSGRRGAAARRVRWGRCSL